MFRLFQTFCLFFAFNSLLSAQQLEAVEYLKTTHNDNTYETTYQVKVNATPEVTKATLTKFMEDLAGDPDRLFEWAFKGIMQKSTNDDNMLLVFHKIDYTPSTGYLLLVVDIVVPSVPLLKLNNKQFDGELLAKDIDEKGMVFNFTVNYNNMVVRKAFASLVLIPQGETTLLQFNSSVRFGAFVDFFVTDKNYKSVYEWRAKGFVENLKLDAESQRARQAGIKVN